MNDSDAALTEYLNRDIVLDMATPFVYVGTLVGGDHRYLFLQNADVHDLRDTSTTRELYVLDSRRYGVRANRQRVLVRREHVVSLSALDEILD